MSDLPDAAPGPVRTCHAVHCTAAACIIVWADGRTFTCCQLLPPSNSWAYQPLCMQHCQYLARCPPPTDQMCLMQPAVIEVALDGVHRTLLLLLADDQARVLRGASNITAEVAASDIFALAPIKAAVQVHIMLLARV